MLSGILTVMLVSSWGTAKKVAIKSIAAELTYVSPPEGFDCHHRMLYKGKSCSDYVKITLTEQRLLSAVKLSVQQFKDCSTASLILKSQKTSAKRDRAYPYPLLTIMKIMNPKQVWSKLVGWGG